MLAAAGQSEGKKKKKKKKKVMKFDWGKNPQTPSFLKKKKFTKTPF